jgi:hypothetical protein
MANKVSRKDAEAFAKGFKNGCDLEVVKSELKRATSKALKSALKNRERRIQNRITPAAKQAAIESHRPFIKEALN